MVLAGINHGRLRFLFEDSGLYKSGGKTHWIVSGTFIFHAWGYIEGIKSLQHLSHGNDSMVFGREVQPMEIDVEPPKKSSAYGENRG